MKPRRLVAGVHVRWSGIAACGADAYVGSPAVPLTDDIAAATCAACLASNITAWMVERAEKAARDSA